MTLKKSPANAAKTGGKPWLTWRIKGMKNYQNINRNLRAWLITEHYDRTRTTRRTASIFETTDIGSCYTNWFILPIYQKGEKVK